jgi:hypothetical protein
MVVQIARSISMEIKTERVLAYDQCRELNLNELEKIVGGGATGTTISTDKTKFCDDDNSNPTDCK